MNPNVLKVLYRLVNAKFEAYLVGGGVRDLLLKKYPKDFDVVSNATPEQIRKLFTNCRLIGRRFRLAHIYFGKEIIEVATFRSNVPPQGAKEHEFKMESGMIVRDNIYGTIEEDAQRRDFTVNALYYNIKDFSVLDYTGGITDLNRRLLRLIGKPQERYQEDPARILRAIRFAAKLGFQLESQTRDAILETKHLLKQVPRARLFEEVRKLFGEGYAAPCFELLLEYDLFGTLFPQTYACLLQEGQRGKTYQLLNGMFENADERVVQQKPVTPAFFFAVLLWTVLSKQIAKHQRQKRKKWRSAFELVASDVLDQQMSCVAIPRHFVLRMKDIWFLQEVLVARDLNRILDCFHHSSFRAAYDLLTLRSQMEEEALREPVKWWTRFQSLSDEGRNAMIANLKRHSDMR
ncbi:MAG: polynucleotide adenylyltransferase PcnB [Gammaproteobacteria bacterium]|nr:polynucleotide adenylyltransferase PcnB [Gammaproteobacteria bacterium]